MISEEIDSVFKLIKFISLIYNNLNSTYWEYGFFDKNNIKETTLVQDKLCLTIQFHLIVLQELIFLIFAYRKKRMAIV
jgi:hypothetical protein